MLEPGLQASAEEDVEEASTAERLGSGDVPVLGTPALLALVERAAVAAVTSELEQGQTTVGTRVELDHAAPTPVGVRITAMARLEAVDGRKLTFSFEANDRTGPVARGTHVRVLVDRERFLADAEARRAP